MDLPKPPQDIELRNIIDKLAQFVARNGPEFEQMTKNKQKGNPKFGFLFGGEHFNYYQYKVTTEQAILKQKQGSNCNAVGSGPPSSINSLILTAQHSPIQSASALQGNQLSLAAAAVTAAQWLAAQQQSQTSAATTHAVLPHQPAVSVAATDSLTQQQATLQDQIRQSELNLSAQHSVLMQQQQTAIEEAIEKVRKESLSADASECNLNFSELDTILQPIIDSCTKDSISNGKAWILQRATSEKANNVISKYLLCKILEPGRTFLHKLHIIYLVNDILHHCARKNVDGLRKCLENVVVPMFCNTAMDVTDEQRNKLNKLLNLWETKNHYCSPETVEKLKQPTQSWAEYQAELINEHSDVLTPITNNTKSTFQSYTSQHQAFVTHALQQIQTLEQQKQTFEAQKQAAAAAAAVAVASGVVSANVPSTALTADQSLTNSVPPQSTNSTVVPPSLQNKDDLQYQQQQQQMMLLQQTAALNQLQQQQDHPQPPPGDPGEIGPPANTPSVSDNSLPSGNDMNNSAGLPPGHSLQDLPPPPHDIASLSFTQPPPGFMPAFPPPGIELPDLSQPPPGFLPGVAPPPPPAAEVMPDDLLPSLPYYDLPAGLMVPLIKLEDCNYKPLDPDEIRLPPPAAPSERLLGAFKAFYSPPGHSHPRDSDGWEKLGLYEYYRAKNAAKKKKDDDVAAGRRELSRSPSPIIRAKSRSKTPPPKKRYRSRSRSRSRGRESRSPQSRRNSSNNYSNNNNSRRNNRNRGRGGSGGGSGGGGGARDGGGSAGNMRNEGGPGADLRSSRSRSRSKSRSRSRSPHNTPIRQENRDRDRSPTPPSFMGSSYGKISTERLDENNKGHQMLRKMGWGGAGLGVKEQGIEQPIQGGEIRDRTDQYKGVGLNLNDPYENFRKSKGQAFITRMKARAEERVQERDRTT